MWKRYKFKEDSIKFSLTFEYNDPPFLIVLIIIFLMAWPPSTTPASRLLPFFPDFVQIYLSTGGSIGPPVVNLSGTAYSSNPKVKKNNTYKLRICIKSMSLINTNIIYFILFYLCVFYFMKT